MKETDTRRTIKISQETERDLRTYLARKGAAGDLSRFVEDAVQEHLLRLEVEEARGENADLEDAELEALVDEAVRAVRREGRP